MLMLIDALPNVGRTLPVQPGPNAADLLSLALWRPKQVPQIGFPDKVSPIRWSYLIFSSITPVW